ncbi:PREDICTED: NEDD8-activating enzyme E1 catalytic subunit-like isoform X2 [Amphimedon queenslandica]|uniref:NEDD8-activating enzyme E1 catalytic subunit n=2 Tax=Amphimedon queenslandica TaxID=400682 RepID=A0AAN0J4D4_AMPQE|nr:PREDICTED: NEDD8-activating enzyme E1 catalytic subunit-like isoform X2 [Amphimedon queenslandica]|eukprot:XP_019851860.1 PREDICTED: NEDD8-activating enzyme E1 catalytic subunit-like isoform X2 [Amphimedon queenslandica]
MEIAVNCSSYKRLSHTLTLSAMDPMEVATSTTVPSDGNIPAGRWESIQYLLTRGSPLAHPDFEPSEETLQFMRDICKLLVIGAGGLGCELLKDLALMGFTNIDCIDMDTIDVSNLNRQFLFRPKDVGQPKATVAARFVNERVPGVNVTPHFAKIQDFPPDFYKKFHIIVCGLDSVVARRWINGMVLSLLQYDNNDQLDPSSIIPLVDGGTEGFKGHARVILAGMTACMDCTMDLYPPQINYPLCTIATKPRLPEHCIEYSKIILWPKEKPFGGVSIDGDNPDHIMWLFEKAQQRAEEFRIQGVSYRLTQGVIKHIIPAVASTNAVIAAACATEVFKLATSCSLPMQNYMVFNDVDGVYTFTFEYERKEDCIACSTRPVTVTVSEEATLRVLYDLLCESDQFMMKAPSLTTVIKDTNKTLYMPTVPAIEEATKCNLDKKLTALGITDNHIVTVADQTTPKSILIHVKFSFNME